VFVDYSETNSGQATPNLPVGSGSPSGSAGSYSPNGLPSTALLFKDAVEIVAEDHSVQPWSYLLEIISETSIADPDVQSKALSLINKTLAGISSEDDFYDVVDSLEEQKLEQMMDFHQKKRRNQDLLKEFKVYEDMISQVYIVEYEDPPPGTPGSGQRRVRRVRNPSLQLSSSTGTPKRSASAHGPKLSVSDISSLLSMVGDGSSTESSPRSESVLITTTPLTLPSPLHPNYLSIQSSDTAEITRLTSRNSVSLYSTRLFLPTLTPPSSLSLCLTL
jgi:hypothetical protein